MIHKFFFHFNDKRNNSLDYILTLIWLTSLKHSIGLKTVLTKSNKKNCATLEMPQNTQKKLLANLEIEIDRESEVSLLW